MRRSSRRKREEEPGEEEEEEEEVAPPPPKRKAPARKASARNKQKAEEDEDEQEVAEAAPVAKRTSARLRGKAAPKEEVASAPTPIQPKPGRGRILTRINRARAEEEAKQRRDARAAAAAEKEAAKQAEGEGEAEATAAAATSDEAGRPKLQRASSFSRNDLLNSSFRDLFGLLKRRHAPSASSEAKDLEENVDRWLTDPTTGEFPDRWVLLNHHHWAVSFVRPDKLLCTADEEEEMESLQLMPSVQVFSRKGLGKRRGKNSGMFEQKKRKAKGKLIDEVSEEDDEHIPLYLDPPDDGTCCIDELPAETLLHIFSFIPTGAMGRAMYVCRTWWAILNDNHLWKQQCVAVEAREVVPGNRGLYGAISVNNLVYAIGKPFTVWEPDTEEPAQVRNDILGRPLPSPKAHFEECQIWSLEKRANIVTVKSLGREKEADQGYIKIPFMWYYRSNYTVNGVHEITFTQYSEPWWFARYQTKSTFENKSEPFHNPDLWRWRLVRSDENEVTGFVQFNIGHFERLVKEGRWQTELHKAELELLITLLTQSYNIDCALYEQQTIPRWMQNKKQEEKRKRRQSASQDGSQELIDGDAAAVEPFRVEQPHGVDIELYSYQRETLTWMKEVEEMVSRGLGWEVVRLLSWEEQTGSRVLFDEDATIHTYSTLDKAKHLRTLVTRGGMLADEMGLGKTLVVLSLIAMQKANVDKIIARDNELRPLDENTFRSKATLVVCPNHLCKQWENEIKKHTNPRLKTYVVNTARGHEKISYKDVINADVVIVSFTFLSNRIYLTTSPSCTPAQVKSQSGDFDPLRAFSPVFHQFRWLRIVLDEGHEVMSDAEGEPILGVMSDYQSVFRWYVTGTPFMAGVNSLRGVLSYLQVQIKEDDRSSRTYTPNSASTLRAILEREAMRNLYCRHTKASVGTEYTLPGVDEEVILIKHTQVEKALYEVARVEGRDKEMFQLCSHPQISNNQCRVLGSGQMDLDDIFQQVLTHKHEQITDAEKELEKTTTDLAKHQRRLKQIQAEFEAEVRKDPNWKPSRTQNDRKRGMELTIRREGKAITKLEKDLVAYRKSLDVLKQMNRKQGSAAAASTSTDAMDEEQRDEAADKQVSAVPNARFMSSDEVDESLVQRYGSKMAHLFVYVKDLVENDDNNRIIVFSQWDKMLGHVSEILEDNGIATVSCRGNVYQRNKAISAFQNAGASADQPRVLMLSLENAASGTNLTGATHILLVDPISGSRKRARAIEAQAIGRAHRLGQTHKVTVVRFIVVDTVEFDAYLNNYRNGPGDDEEDDDFIDDGAADGRAAPK